MKKTSPTVVFFGSGPVAARSLELLAKDFRIEAVVTKPRPPHFTGDVPVLRLADELDIPTRTVADRKELDALIAAKPFSSSVAILVDFGIIVSQAVIDYFPKGIINSHFSLLPEWRGADPITFAVLSGQKQTGVSLMLLVAAMDEGPLLAQASCNVDKNTTKELTSRLIDMSNKLLHDKVPDYLAEHIHPYTQDSGKQVSYSRKLTKEDGLIDWSKPADQLEREVRAFVGWPGSQTKLAGKDVTITKAHVVAETGARGSCSLDQHQLHVYCGKDALAIERLKPAGGKEMDIRAFLAGYGRLLSKG